MSLTPRLLKQYHVFLASPGDVNVERQHVRRFFDDYNRGTAHLWNAEFRVIDWESIEAVRWLVTLATGQLFVLLSQPQQTPICVPRVA